jgi:hypothetical protein
VSKGIDVSFADIPSPIPGDDWTNATNRKRMDLIVSSIQDYVSDIDISVVEANKGGQISVIINDTLSADERGSLLLDIEEFLKLNVDNGITVWHAPIGDKSSLRNLRGIEVLS